MSNLLIKTNRLVIKGIVEDDAYDMFEYRKDNQVVEFQSFKPQNVSDVIDFIKRYCKNFNIENEWYQLGIYLEKKIIGDIGIHFLGPNNLQCEIGYTISPKYQNIGFGKESVRAVINYLFNELGKHRIIASVNPINSKSVKLLKSLGFREEGCFRKSIFANGKWEDDLIYAILEEEWKR